MAGADLIRVVDLQPKISEYMQMLLRFALIHDLHAPYTREELYSIRARQEQMREGRVFETLAVILGSADVDAMFAVTLRTEGGHSLVLAKDSEPSPDDRIAARTLFRSIMRPDVTSWQHVLPLAVRCALALDAKLRAMDKVLGDVVSSEQFQQALQDHESLWDEEDEKARLARQDSSRTEGMDLPDYFMKVYRELRVLCRNGISVEDPQATVAGSERAFLLVEGWLRCYFLDNLSLDLSDQYFDLFLWANSLLHLLKDILQYKQDVEYTLQMVKEIFDGHDEIPHEWVSDGLSPISPEPVVPGRNLEATIRRIKISVEHLLSDYKKVHEELFSEWENQGPVTLHVHAEIQLILYFRAHDLAAGTEDAPLVIGTSKPCCLCCCLYIATYNEYCRTKWRTTTTHFRVIGQPDVSWAVPDYPTLRAGDSKECNQMCLIDLSMEQAARRQAKKMLGVVFTDFKYNHMS